MEIPRNQKSMWYASYWNAFLLTISPPTRSILYKTDSFSHTQCVGPTSKTRWYPQGIQKLVPTYELRKTPWGGGPQTNSNAKCQDLQNFSFFGGVCGGGGVTPDQLKCKVPRSAQIFIFRGVGFDFRSTQI